MGWWRNNGANLVGWQWHGWWCRCRWWRICEVWQNLELRAHICPINNISCYVVRQVIGNASICLNKWLYLGMSWEVQRLQANSGRPATSCQLLHKRFSFTQACIHFLHDLILSEALHRCKRNGMVWSCANCAMDNCMPAFLRLLLFSFSPFKTCPEGFSLNWSDSGCRRPFRPIPKKSWTRLFGQDFPDSPSLSTPREKCKVEEPRLRNQR